MTDIVETAEPGVFALYEEGDRVGEADGEERARLYAASPDMLEALRAVLPLIPETLVGHGIARAAIAKAEGASR